MPNAKELEKFNKLQKILEWDLKWENEEEKLRYYMTIPPQKKLERLRKIQEFLCSVSPKSAKIFLRKLKERR